MSSVFPHWSPAVGLALRLFWSSGGDSHLEVFSGGVLNRQLWEQDRVVFRLVIHSWVLTFQYQVLEWFLRLSHSARPFHPPLSAYPLQYQVFFTVPPLLLHHRNPCPMSLPHYVWPWPIASSVRNLKPVYQSGSAVFLFALKRGSFILTESLALMKCLSLQLWQPSFSCFLRTWLRLHSAVGAKS